MSATRLIIARHGNTFAPGETVTRLGITDKPLVESGRKQAVALGQALHAASMVPAVVYTSQLLRTREMAEITLRTMQHDCPTRQLPLFNEIDYGIDENMPEEIVIARVGKDALEAWDSACIPPDGWQVSPQDIIGGLKDFAASVLTSFSGQTVLVITSNGIARFAPHLCNDTSLFKKNGLKLATGAYGVLEHTDATGWRCSTWNIRPKKNPA